MKAVVVGAGLAGLAAACELADLGHEVAVHEARPWAGGKAYSTTGDNGEARDNGQHVLLGCTTAYVAFLQRLGTLRLTYRQRRLRVPVFDAQGRDSVLASDPVSAPLHLARSFATYRHLSLGEKREAGRLMLAVWHDGARKREAARGRPFAEWLRDHGQSQATIERFWDFLLLPTLNCRAAEADAADALFVVHEGFLRSSTGSAIGVSRVGLTELHAAPAQRYIVSRGGRVVLRSRVAEVEVQAGHVAGLRLADGSREAADVVIVAVANEAAAALATGALADDEGLRRAGALKTAAIVNLHFGFDAAVAAWPFAAFAGSELQWAFNRDVLDMPGRPRRHKLVVSLSGGEKYLDWSPARCQEHFLPLLRRAVPGARQARLLRFEVTKEPHATFVPAPGALRPANQTSVGGLYLAGAHTNTGWPATMESAVRSGIRAARLAHVRSVTSGPSVAGGLARG